MFHMVNTGTSNSFRETPLILACKSGALNIAKDLVEVAKVDVNQRAKISILPEVTGKNLRVYEGTALHAAIIFGHDYLVSYLCSLGNTDVNATVELMQPFCKSETNGDVLTPLHLAIGCDWLSPNVKREIFLCLIEYGADWKIYDRAGKQCWEYKSDVAITRCMISRRVGLHSTQNKSSSNIVHKWARAYDQNASSLISYAISRGADLYEADHNGLTPLMVAATRKQPDIHFFELILHSMNQPNSRLYKIDGLELMGATLVTDGYYNRTKGVNYWKMAMNLRFNVAGEPSIPKPPLVLDDSFRAFLYNASEIQTLEDLESLPLDNTDMLIKQAHLVYFRILGIRNNETISFLTRYVDFLGNDKVFLYSKLILSNCDITKDDMWQKWTVFIFHSMRSVQDLNPSSIDEATISDAMVFLRQLTDRLQKTSNGVKRTNTCRTVSRPIVDENCISIRFILKSILFWTNVVMNYLVLNPNECFNTELKRCLSEAIRLGRRDWSTGYDLLLLACDPFSSSIHHPASGRYAASVRCSVTEKVLNILIECGAEPNSVCNKGETALHILASFRDTFSLQAIKILHEGGAHLDQVNADGETVSQIMSRACRIPYEKCIIEANKMEFPSLKCMCSRILQQSTIFLHKHLPKKLVEFVQRH